MTDATAPRSTRLAVLIPFGIVTLVWGSTWLVIRDQVSSVPPSWSVCYRFLVGGTGMAVLALVRREKFALDARGWGFAGLIALTQFCLNFNFVYRAEEHITSGIVAVVFALMLVPNALFARIFLGQRMGAQLLIGSAVAMAGIALLFLHEVRLSQRGPGEAVLGIALTGIAILCASSSNVLQATKTAKRYPMVPTLAAAMLIGATVDGIIALVLSGPPVMEWRPAYLGGIVYLGLIGSTLTFPLYFGVVRTIGPAKAAYSGVIVPVIAMLLSTLFEGYRWTGLAVAGAALAGAGLVIALRARRPNR
ncbi:MAG: EamA family transporter [Sphingomonas sp.]|uniref:DMT family transporter n=1 Tax=Sphingomonas sp. TaxID=28214 RepID=UPI003567D385